MDMDMENYAEVVQVVSTDWPWMGWTTREREIVASSFFGQFGYFVTKLSTFWCTYTGLNNAVVYQNWKISSMGPKYFCTRVACLSSVARFCPVYDALIQNSYITSLFSRLEHTSVVTSKGIFLMGGEFSPNTTELIDPHLENSVESFPLLPGRVSHCLIKVSFWSTGIL